MPDLHGSVCLNHPNTLAVARCATCSKPICAECAQEHDGVKYCSDLCWQNAKRTGLMVDDVNRRKGAANFKRRIVQLIQLIIVLAVILGGYHFYKTHKATVDAKLKQAQQKVEQGAKDAKKAVEDNTVNRSSTYKRNIEKIDASDLAK